MKFSAKALIVTAALTILMATPVFATEKNLDAELNNIEKHTKVVYGAVHDYLKTDDGCGKAAKDDHGQHVEIVRAQVAAVSGQEFENYVNYLKAVVGNKVEAERVALQFLNSVKDLAKVNAQYEAQIPAAQAAYEAAVADHAAALQAIVDAQAAYQACAQYVDTVVRPETIQYEISLDK